MYEYGIILVQKSCACTLSVEANFVWARYFEKCSVLIKMFGLWKFLGMSSRELFLCLSKIFGRNILLKTGMGCCPYEKKYNRGGGVVISSVNFYVLWVICKILNLSNLIGSNLGGIFPDFRKHGVPPCFSFYKDFNNPLQGISLTLNCSAAYTVKKISLDFT